MRKEKPLLSARAVERAGIPARLLTELEKSGTLPPVIKTPTRSYWAKADVDRLLGGVLAERSK